MTKIREALSESNNDIVVLTGDVHFGRISSAKLNDNGNKIIEVVSSPMSNLTGIYSMGGLATPDKDPKEFPPIKIGGVKKRKITYHRSTSVRGPMPTDYYGKRSREHITNISFSKNEDGKIHLRVNCWRVRSNVESDELPLQDYREWTTDLSPVKDNSFIRPTPTVKKAVGRKKRAFAKGRGLPKRKRNSQ